MTKAITWAQFQQDWAPHWDNILQAQHNRNPFLLLAWLQHWQTYFAQDQHTEILLNPDLQAALFTRHLRETYHRMPLRMVRAWVNNHCARAGLLAGSAPAQFAQELAQHWQKTRKSWDILRLQGLPEAFATLLAPQLEQHGFKVINERRWIHYGAAITPPWDSYFASTSSESRRVQGRRGRRLAELGDCQWQRFQGEAVAAALERYLDIEVLSWKLDSGEVIRQDPQLLAFYRQVIAALASNQQSQVDLLLLDQQPICGILSLLSQGLQLTIKISYLKDYAKYSLGWQIIRAMLEGTFADGAADTVDFYSGADFSAIWATQESAFCDLLVFGTTMRGRLAGLAKDMQGRLKGTT